MARDPKRSGGVPPTVRHAIPLFFERDWRDDLQPRYRAAVAAADARVESTPIADLPDLIDELADLAGESFVSITALSGATYKMEILLSGFYRRHLAKKLGGGHLPLLAGFEPPAGPDPHAVVSLDWWYPPMQPLLRRGRLRTTRGWWQLARQPRRQPSRHLPAHRSDCELTSLLAETQRLLPIREEQTRELTIAWPVMRRAVIRIGEALATRGCSRTPTTSSSSTGTRC